MSGTAWIVLLSLSWIAPVWAEQLVEAAPPIAARAYLLQDFHSGQVLLEKDAAQQVDPASLTKLMTAYIVFSELRNGRLKLEDLTTISEKAWRMDGSRMYIEVNTQVTVQDLLKGMIIQSGNDASVALAEQVAGSEEAFAVLMNQYAERLGMKHTRYANSTGMPAEGHYSTVQDLALITVALIRDFPEYYKLYSEREYTYNKISQPNRNLLLYRDPSVDGVKTGYTEAAGYCLIASAQRERMRLVSVVVGTDSEKARAEESQKLLNYGFRVYETHQVYPARHVLANERVWQGTAKTLPLGLAEPLYVTVPKGQYPKLAASLRLGQKLIAPIQAETPLGSLQLSLAGQVLQERPVIALASLEEGNWLQWLADSVLLMFE